MTSTKTEKQDVYDVAIVGGGPAGLSAALWLARYLHSVVLIDSGDPRNWETRGVNGFLGSQGIKSPDLRKRGRDDAESFGATLLAAVVDKVENVNSERFVLTLQSGDKIESRRLLLAIGIKDVWPRIPGLADCYGETVHVCPDCDGYDVRGCKTIVVGAGRKAVGMAFSITTWTPEIVICTNGEKPDMEPAWLDKLKALNIPVLEEKIEKVSSENKEIRCITLEGGMQLDCDRLFFAIGQYPADDLGAQLKCKRNESGLIEIDERYHTSVMNVFAAGDIVPGPQLAVAAASDGAIAALAIHASLVPEARKLD
ncbi:MAG TPA: NAD(P)/FAD-dependent oxidoreductase [Gemmatimonadaceae bacterium]|nr:NAD(P)/FAD-dependent oxidoreductase [Gemmatimonadaceae bacterium]